MNVVVSSVQPGVFVQPAGAQLRCAPDEYALLSIWEEVGECFAYAKPDGWRMQIHKQGEAIHLFSRSGKDWTREFPDVVEMIQCQVKHKDAILDTELVGFDTNGHHLDPSELPRASERRCYLLDALYLNGSDLTNESTKKRVGLLWEYLQESCQGKLIFSNYTLIGSPEELVRFYTKCRQRRSEGFDGAIIKHLDTPYFTDVLKVKPRDTVDAVVVGAYLNEEGVVNKLLLALPSSADRSWKPIAKVVGHGSSWDAICSACQRYVTLRRPYNLDYVPQKPDVWVEPKVVVAVQLTEFKLHQKNYLVYADAARECVLREDKGPGEVDSFEQAYQKALSTKIA